MGQAEDALLDLVVEMQKTINSLSSVSEDHEFDDRERARMESEASGVAMALAMVNRRLKEGRGRVY